MQAQQHDCVVQHQIIRIDSSMTCITHRQVGNQACPCAAVKRGGPTNIAHAELKSKAIMNPTTNASRFDGEGLSIS